MTDETEPELIDNITAEDVKRGMDELALPFKKDMAELVMQHLDSGRENGHNPYVTGAVIIGELISMAAFFAIRHNHVAREKFLRMAAHSFQDIEEFIKNKDEREATENDTDLRNWLKKS